ncbi:C-reactive protein-like [Pygocentrus nattereri]|uniref:Pentraxin (PTX) domain-containing protein n=1 Tax=Pygocentrus nattereri TaxID=42514 RepID=A0AAR2IVR7_PYGNA|nr:C-reactive protein-like [Pygocentrus nattereri]
MMDWALLSMCFLAVVIPAEGQTASWQKGNLQGWMFNVVSGGEVRFRSDAPANVTGLTVCMRVLIENPYYRVQLTFGNSTDGISYTGPVTTNPLYYLDIEGATVSFKTISVSFEQQWPWRNRCFTWESSSRMAQLWFDGRMSIRKSVGRGQVFSGQAELTISEFEGQVSDVYVWDSALSVKHLYCYLALSHSFPPGSVLDWRHIQYSTSGYALLEPTYLRPFSEKPTRRRKHKRERGLRKDKRRFYEQ